MPIQDGWALDLDSRDPSIPNLPLESPAAPEVSATRAQSSGEAFRTRTSGSRRRVPTPTQATFTPASQPAVFPVAALGGAIVRRRRDTTNRRALEVGDITSALVAPLIATLPRPKANIVWFERRIQLPLPLAIYPPPVGPPASVTLPAPTASRRHDGPRRQQPSLLAEFTASPPTTSPVTIAALAARKVHKRRQRHGLLLSGGAGIFDSPAVTYEVTPAALHQQGHFKRRDTERRLQTVTPLAIYEVATSTPSDALVTGEPFRTSTSRSRRMVRQPVPASFAAGTPATFAVTALPAPEVHRRHSRRRLLPPLALAQFTPTPPTTAPVVALPIPKANRRRPRRGVLLTGGDRVFQPPYIVLPAPKAFRVEHRRKLVLAPTPATFPAATPPPAQPTFKLDVIRRRETRRVLVRLTPLAEYAYAAPPTFAVVALPAPKAFKVVQHRKLILPPVWVDAPATPVAETPPRRGGGRPRPNRSAYPAYKRPRLNEQLDALLESVSAAMAYEAVASTAPAAVKAKAEALIQPYTDADVDVVDWAALEADAKRVGALMALWTAEQARLKRIRDDDEWLMWED